MKKIRLILAAAAALTYGAASACTNFIVTRGASTDGSVMVTYAADSHALYGALYHTPGGKHKSGAMLPVYEWDTGRYLRDIPQVRETYSTIGNMNEHSLIIGETLVGKRTMLRRVLGVVFGSCLYRFIVAVALRFNVPAAAMKLVSAIIVAVAISMPAIREHFAFEKRRHAARARRTVTNREGQ